MMPIRQERCYAIEKVQINLDIVNQHLSEPTTENDIWKSPASVLNSEELHLVAAYVKEHNLAQ